MEPISVLLVDDNPTTCNLFKIVFEHHHCHLTVANSAHLGLESLQTGTHPDVIIIDIRLPDMDGYQMLETIRQHGLDAGAKVVATTAYHTMDTQTRIYALSLIHI